MQKKIVFAGFALPLGTNSTASESPIIFPFLTVGPALSKLDEAGASEYGMASSVAQIHCCRISKTSGQV